MGDSRGGVLITGASTGIGRACALHLAEVGFTVLAGVRKPADGEALVAAGGEAIVPIEVDVTDLESIRAAATQATTLLEGVPLRGLVNNAGIALGGAQEYLEADVWRRQFDVNLFGAIEMTRAVLHPLLACRGRVINMSSAGGRVSSPFLAPYHASKFALEAVTDALRMELRPFGVWACCIEPGAVKTEIWSKADTLIEQLREELPAEALAKYRDGITAIEKFSAGAAKRGVPPLAVAKKVEHALTARRPRTRYLVGLDAHLMVRLHWLLPNRWFEALAAAFVSRG